MATAKQPNLDEAPDEGVAKKKSGLGSKLMLIIVVAVVLALIGVGATVFLLLQKKDNLATGESEQSAAPAPSLVDLSKPPVFVALDPFVVNLQPEDGERYLQVVMAVRVNDAKTGDSLKNFMPAIRHALNLRLTGKLPSEISTPAGQEALAQEMTADINTVLGSPLPNGPAAPVHSVLFNSIIIQ